MDNYAALLLLFLFLFYVIFCSLYKASQTSFSNHRALNTYINPKLKLRSESVRKMASRQQNRQEMDERARQGETVVPGGTGGKSLEAQEHLAEGRSRGGQTRKEQLGTEGYQEMGRKGGMSTMDKSGGERAEEEDVDIDESKFTTASGRNQNK